MAMHVLKRGPGTAERRTIARLQHARLDRGLSLQHVADMIDRDYATLWRIENGYQRLRVDDLYDLASVYGIDPVTPLPHLGPCAAGLGHRDTPAGVGVVMGTTTPGATCSRHAGHDGPHADRHGPTVWFDDETT